MMNKDRISWEEYALKIAEVASLRSEDIVKVGACALDYSNRVIGVAYNGLAQGKEVEQSFWEDRDKRRPFLIHAETNLLSLFSRNQCNILACTLLPCSQCALNIVAHGIKKVVYKDTYFRDDLALEIFKFYGVECSQIIIQES